MALHNTDAQLDEVAKSIRIPACPALLTNFQQEMAKPDPEPRVLSAIISRDVAMSATLLKMANSAFFNLRRPAESIDQALGFLGIRQCAAIMAGLIARKALPAEGPYLTRFWDVSDKRAMAMSLLAKRLKVGAQDIAHTFGLFCDIGIPLLLNRFPSYMETLQLANNDSSQRFTSVEDQRHQMNHATIGSLLARSWGLPADVVLAIRLHHEYEILPESCTPDPIRNLVALGLLVERVIQSYQNRNHHMEWEKGGQLVMETLGLSGDEVEDICEEMHILFDEMS